MMKKYSILMKAGLLVLALLTIGFNTPNAHAESSSIQRFIRNYRLAWSAPTPIPLLNLAVSPGLFTELADLDRWDFLENSDVEVELLQHGRTSGSEFTVEVRRLQRDRFIHGTYTVGEVRERLVLSPWRGELRIKRYLGAISAVRRSSLPRTWASNRHSERLLMNALEALSVHDPEDCLDNIYGLFQGEGRSEVPEILPPEPFEGSKTALSNLYFVRAACTRIALEDVETSAGEDHVAKVKASVTMKDVLDDLNRALEADYQHHLARLLRSRIALSELDVRSPVQNIALLKQAKSDLDILFVNVPDLEDTRELKLWAELLYSSACNESASSCKNIPMQLLQLHTLLPSEALESLERAGLFQAQNEQLRAYALELSLMAGNSTAAKKYADALEKTCKVCSGRLYLEARRAELEGRVEDAVSFYHELLLQEPTYRDALWRYAEQTTLLSSVDWQAISTFLINISHQLNERDSTALRLLVAVAKGEDRGLRDLLRVAKNRFGDKPLPASVRKAMVRALRLR